MQRKKQRHNIHRGINRDSQTVQSYGLSVTLHFEWRCITPMCGFNCNEDEPNCCSIEHFDWKLSEAVLFSVCCNNFGIDEHSHPIDIRGHFTRCSSTELVCGKMGILFSPERSICLIRSPKRKIKTMRASVEMPCVGGGFEFDFCSEAIAMVG